jgi:hypothetical protein
MSGTTISGTSMSGVTLTQAADNPALVTGTITVASGTALYGVDDMAWSVTNAGLVGSEAGYGVSLAAGGSVTNQATGTIYGTQAGVKITGAAGTVVNAGSIAGSGTAADAVSLAAGYANTVIVDPGASFIGTVDGGNAPGSGPASVLELASAAGAGTLTGLGTQYIGFGHITVDAGATWSLTADALGGGYVIADAGTLTNTGSLGSAVTLAANGVLTNSGSGTITGVFAVFGAGPNVTVTNAGSLGGEVIGVLLPGGGTVINQQSATITAAAASENGVQLATTVVNNGLISASGYGAFGASYVDNQTYGTIVGGHGGANLAAGSLVNAGSIVAGGTYGIGVLLQSDGMVSNQAGGVITGSGLGINLASGAGTVVNDGVVSGGYYGVARAATVVNNGAIAGGKAGLNLSGGTVVNYGSIGATGTGSSGILLQNGGFVRNGAHVAVTSTVTRTGTSTVAGTIASAVTDTVTGTVIGTITGVAIGINLSGGVGTVENAGYIGGTLDAISMGAGLANRVIVDPGATFAGTVDGGAGSSSTLELASGGAGTLRDLGSQYVDFSQVIVDPGATWTLTGDNTLAAEITLAAGATLEVAGTVASNETIVFDGAGAELVVDSTASMAGTVTNFTENETIDLRGVDPASVAYPGDGKLHYGDDDTSFPLSLGVAGTVQAATDNNAGADVTALCFCAGTRLATPDGEVPVEHLAVGDLVLTAHGAARPIVWIGVGRVLAARGRRSAATPVIVRKDALAPNVPHHDLRVTKGHAFWLDGVLIPVEFLVNHRSILWDDRAQEVALYHVELDCHDVLLANGAPAESYRDDGNRWLFANANSGWGRPTLLPCAPVLTGGPQVDAAWQRLLEQAGKRPGLPVTEDPDLHLLVDGVRLDAAWSRHAAHVFRLPARPDTVRVMSRSGVPQELGWSRDPRLLGVALRRVMLRRAARLVVVEAEDTRLVHGFHAYEDEIGLRWTDGDGVLPAEPFAAFAGPVELEVHLGGTTRYLADPLVVAA